mgnify:CR=1 FL=1
MASQSSEVTFVEEAPTVRRIDTGATLRLGIVGVSERGEIGTPILATSDEEFRRKCGGYTLSGVDLRAAVQGYFDNGGTQLYFSRVVHCTDPTDPTTKTSAAATKMLLTAAASPTPGVVTSAVGPFVLAHGDTLLAKIDGGADQTITIAATAAARESASAGAGFVLVNGMGLNISIDGVALPAKTFATAEFANIALATATEVKNSLNAHFASSSAGAVATVTNIDRVTITSNRKGTGSGVNVSGGTANAILLFTTGNVAGTGNVSNVVAVTATELVAMWVALPLTGAAASVVSGALRITSATTGALSSVQINASSTMDDELGLDNAVHTGLAGTPVNTLKLDGKTDGAFGNTLSAQVTAASNGDADRFNLYILVSGVVRERFFDLSLDVADARYVETVVNDAQNGSIYVVATDQEAAVTSPGNLPAVATSSVFSGGDDGLVGLVDADFIGGTSSSGDVGLRVLDSRDIDVLVVPGKATSAVHNAMVTYVEITRAGLCFAVLDPPANTSAEGMVTYVKSTASLYQLTEHAAIYWPRVKVSNPSSELFGSSPTITVPPSGHIAGVYARVDASKIGGAFDHPAGVDTLYLPRNVLGLESEQVLKKPQRNLLFPSLINPISQEGGPIFIDGARTLKDNGNWPTVGQRRGVIFVEKRLVPGLAFMRHRPIQDRLFQAGARTVTLFLVTLTAAGALGSTLPKDAFFVDFGAALNTAAAAKARTVYARIGLATAEPAEFIVLLVSPDTRALDAELAAAAA